MQLPRRVQPTRRRSGGNLIYYLHAQTSLSTEKSKTHAQAWVPYAHEVDRRTKGAQAPEGSRAAPVDGVTMLPSSHRLPRNEVNRVLRHGYHIREDGVELVYKKVGTTQRFAFIVSKKIDKRATVRNRIRRMMSESVRHLLAGINPCDAIIIAKADLSELTQTDVQKMVGAVLRKAGLL